MEVYRVLGPGLLESAYEECLCYELDLRGLRYEHQKPLPVVYKDGPLDAGCRLDVLVDNLVVLELKAVEALLPIHEPNLLTCLKLGGQRWDCSSISTCRRCGMASGGGC